jgi:catechol 2,3-dioxygenase-like lactoylglutathione lyase family enzyme
VSNSIRSRSSAGVPVTRRSALVMVGALTLMPAWAGRARAENPVEVTPLPLPLRIKTICGHCGVSVPDVTRAALFYSKLFGGDTVTGEKQPFLRYMINLSGDGVKLGEGGGVAIGKLGTLGSVGQTKALIDHFCLNAERFDDVPWQARLKAEGLTSVGHGVFLDIDKIAVQISGGEGGENLAAGKVETMEALYTGEPLVRPGGYEHIMLHVSNVEQSVAFYRKMFGLTESKRTSGVTYFSDGATRLALRQTAPNEKPNIHHYAVKVPAFDRARMTRGLAALGATVQPAAEESKHAIRFADPDGLIVELWPT